MFVNLICWIAIGLTGGFIASRLVNQRGDDPKLGIMLGAAGAVVFGLAFGMFGKGGLNEFNVGCLWAAVVGAAVALVGWNIVRGLASRA
jgi:uncharacterized membrane protein YeaQ/YmgE (transglycosylase-associated protein family)